DGQRSNDLSWLAAHRADFADPSPPRRGSLGQTTACANYAAIFAPTSERRWLAVPPLARRGERPPTPPRGSVGRQASVHGPEHAPHPAPRGGRGGRRSWSSRSTRGPATPG